MEYLYYKIHKSGANAFPKSLGNGIGYHDHQLETSFSKQQTTRLKVAAARLESTTMFDIRWIRFRCGG